MKNICLIFAKKYKMYIKYMLNIGFKQYEYIYNIL